MKTIEERLEALEEKEREKAERDLAEANRLGQPREV